MPTPISRAVVIATLVGTTLFLCLRRAAWRLTLYKRYEKGLDTRNVLVIGTGSLGLAIRSHLQRIRHLGFTFKGFVQISPDGNELGNLYPDSQADEQPMEILGNLPELGDLIRRHFIDEIFVTGPCERGVVKRLIAQASVWGVDVRVVPDLYDGLAWSAPIEYVGQFPTMPLHRHHIPVVGLLMKRCLDIVISLARVNRSQPGHSPHHHCDSTGFSRSNFLRSRTHWQKRPHLPLLEVPHHGGQRRFAA